MSTRSSRIATLLAGLAFTGLAHGHAVVNETNLPAGTLQFITIRITHACSGSPTTSLRVLIPDDVTRVTAGYIPGWTVERRMRKLDKPYQAEGGVTVTDTVAELIWKGGPPVPDGLFAEFKLRAMLPATPGRTLYFKTIQNCQKGEIRWIEVPKSGEADFNFSDPKNPVTKSKEPSPFVKLVAPPAR
jgi:uncharacterized protein YcnI